MANYSFPAHGYCRLSTQGQIVHISARGPWNREALVQCRNDLDQLVIEMQGKPWGLLGSLSGDALLLPEAASVLRQGLLKDLQRGRVATAYLLNEVVLSDLVQELFHKVFEGIEHQVRFFHCADTARHWLTHQIGTASSLQELSFE